MTNAGARLLWNSRADYSQSFNKGSEAEAYARELRHKY